MAELGHPLSTHLMLTEKQRFYFIMLPNWIDKTYQHIMVYLVYIIIISITYRIYKYYDEIFALIFDR